MCKLRITTLPEKFREQQNQLLRICCALLVLTTGGLLTDIGTVLAPESVKPGGVLFSANAYYLGFSNSLIWGCTWRVYAFAFSCERGTPLVFHWIGSLIPCCGQVQCPSLSTLVRTTCASATVICVTLREVRRELWGNGLASQSAWA